MKRAWNTVLSLMVSAVLVVGLMPAFAVADEGDAAAGEAAALEEGGVGPGPAEMGEAPGEPAADAGDPTPADGQEAWQDGASGEPQEAPEYAEPESPEPGLGPESEGLAEGAAGEPLYPDQPGAVEGEGGEEPLDPVEEEADDPEGEEADLESQADDAEAAYAILYANGDLVFQRGDAEDPSEGEVLGKWTGFELTGSSPWSGLKSDVRGVRFADAVSPVSTYGWFDGCSNLTSFDPTNLDTSSVTDMGYMFDGCSSLQSLDLTGLDASSTTTMRSMFRDCSSLASLDLSGLDASSVTNMYSMFSGCSALQSLDLSGLDASSVTDMQSMFSGCSSLRSLDLSCLDTSSATDMSSMFSGCSSLRSLDLSGLDASSVTSMGSMFYHCSSLVHIDLTGVSGSIVTRHLDGTWVDKMTGKQIAATIGQESTFPAGDWAKLQKRTITKNAGAGGKVELRSPTLYPYAGDEVVFRTIPGAGKELASFNVTYTDPATGKAVRLVTGKGITRRAGTGAPGTISEYAFSMPDCDVAINATFGDNVRTYKISKNLTGTGKAGSNLQLVGSDGKPPETTGDKVKPTMYPKAAQTVYFKSVPAKGARLTKFNVTYSYTGLDGKTVNAKLYTGHGITSHGGGLYSFTMPCYPVTLTGEFTK